MSAMDVVEIEMDRSRAEKETRKIRVEFGSFVQDIFVSSDMPTKQILKVIKTVLCYRDGPLCVCCCPPESMETIRSTDQNLYLIRRVKIAGVWRFPCEIKKKE